MGDELEINDLEIALRKLVPPGRIRVEAAELQKLSPARRAERLKAIRKIREDFDAWDSGKK